MKYSRRLLWIASFLGAALLGGFLANVFAPRQVQAAALAAFGQPVKVTLLDVPNVSTTPDQFGATAVKIADVGTVTVENSGSLLEVTHNGRLLVQGINGANGVYFELRVDDTNGLPVETGQPSGMGLVRDGEDGQYVQLTFTGYWQGLPAGVHTVSMWARTSSGVNTGDNALLDPGGWPSNIVIVKEYLPYGSTFLPAVER